MSQSVIDDKHLIPEDKTSHSLQTATNGILREYWTNYPDGDLTGLGGPRPFESALTIKNVGIRIEGQGQLPNPEQIRLGSAVSAGSQLPMGAGGRACNV